MNVTVKFFAALREQVGRDSLNISLGDDHSVQAVWREATSQPLDPHVLVAINQEYASRESTVADGDEIAFFPPVTGG